jgi:hypothetical protein
MQPRLLAILAGSLAACLASDTLAQPDCQPIVTIDGAAGLDRPIAGMVRWDLDGSGPQPPRLVFTGDFTTADGLSTPGNVFWTGSNWQTLNNSASSLVGSPLFVHQGQLQTLRNRLNGSTWEPLPALPTPLDSGTLSLPVSFGENVALVRVTSGPNVSVTIHTINFTTGQTQQLAFFSNANSNSIRSLFVFQNELYAAGSFTSVNGQPSASKVIRYDAATQAWLPVGALTQNVQALGIIDDSLVAGGRFSTASGERLLLRLINNSWEPFGPAATGSAAADFIKSVDSRSWFAATDPSTTSRRNLCEVDATGAVLNTHVVGGAVRELALAPEGVYVAGSFSQVSLPDQTVQLASMQNVARIDPAGIPRHVARNPQTLGIDFGLPSSVRFNQISRFSSFQGAPVAVGRFIGPSNSNRGHVAIMDANGAWQPLGDNIVASNIGSPEVSDAVEFQGQLIIGGAFRLFNGTTTVNGRLARWNTQTQAWDVLANVNASQPFPVNAFLVRGSQLVVGGSMTSINGVSTGNVATWNGTTWASIGANMPGTVFRLASYQGDLYAGASSGSLGVARWSGTVWQPLGTGLQGIRDVYDLHVHSGKLYVSGTFSSASNVPGTARIAAWDGSAWSALSSVGRPTDSSSSNYSFEAFGPDLAIGLSAAAPLSSAFLYNDAAGWRPLPGFKQGATGLSDLAFIGNSLFLGGLSEVFGQSGIANTHLQRLQFPCPICDSIDFNNDGSLFDPTDVDAFLSVFSEGPCIPASATCNDIDFNNDGNAFDPADIASFLSVYSEGPCL